MRVNGRSNRACEGRRLNIRHSFNPIGSRIPSLPLSFFFNKETVNFLPSAKMDKKEEEKFFSFFSGTRMNFVVTKKIDRRKERFVPR